ncbi:hypothetical protein NQ314_006145 [Rhamnusium bicolor]|uniref:ERAP1-like C-terminal domain-containing protein n=1 Tax=Rhamnusium bicolor TaxID=1586634 RepID=A0AAV8Z921_9CUCU|nr:hypothetical protein NQ314_006145 [Rhamnusium bicolor]
MSEPYQKRFVYPTENSPNYDNDKWAIPLTSTSQGVKNFEGFLNVFLRPDQDLSYSGESNTWIMFNLKGGSFYRVNYEEQLWKRIISSLKSAERTEIHVLNRARLVDDIFNIARIGDVSYALAFELADFLVDETEYYPWYSALNAFTYIIGKLEDDEVETNLEVSIHVVLCIARNIYFQRNKNLLFKICRNYIFS